MKVKICIPNLILSYGVLWVQLASNEVPLWLGLAAPSSFLFVYGLTQCWFREAADSWGGPMGYRVMAAIGLFIIVISLIICAFIPLYFQPVVYGIFGGFGASLISTQVDAVLYETYDSRLGLVRGMCYTGQAVGQSLFPHILFVLTNIYGYAYSYIILGGIMLQTLPAILILKVDETKKYAYFSNDKELSQTLTCYKNEGIDNLFGTELQLHSLTKKCWKSPSDDNLHRVDEFDCDDGNVLETITPPPSPEEKRRNIFGVEILPEIPEESETDEISISELSLSVNKKRLSNAIKRFSTLGDNIDECITSQGRKDSLGNIEVNENTEIEVTYETIEPITDIQTEKLFNSFGFRSRTTYTNLKRKFWIPSYKLYRAKRRVTYLICTINDTFLKPLTRSLSCGAFYPALLLNFTKLSVTVQTVLMPVIASRMHPNIPVLEANFLISLQGFTWICFAVCTPWLVQTKRSNYKYITVCGLVISTSACFVFLRAENLDLFSIGYVVAGFGYGIIISSWEKTAHELVGTRKWAKIHSTLETLSASLIALFCVGLFYLILMLPCVTCSNIDCNGKAFHCVNSTHFKICVDFGGGISTTVDEYLIQCPQDTVCKSYNLYECEYEKTTTSPTVTVQSEVTNELFESIGVSFGEYSDVTTVFPSKQEQGKTLNKNYGNTDTTSERPISTLPSNYVLNNVTDANLNDLNYNTTLKSLQELFIEKNIVSPKNSKTLPQNIIQSVTENYNDTSNSTETPLFYSTLLDRVLNDNLINKKLTSLSQQPATSSVSLDLNIGLNQDVNNLKRTDLNNVAKLPLKNSVPDTTHIVDDNNFPNKVTALNDLNFVTTYNNSQYNKSDFVTNSYQLEFSTIGPSSISSSVNVSSELNSFFIKTTETYYTDEALQININKAKNMDPLQKLKEETFTTTPIEDTTDNFLSTMYEYSNTEVDIGKLKYTYPNLEDSELFKFNDKHIEISTPSLPTSGNINNITSQRNIVLDNGVDSDTKIDLFLDKQNFTHIDKEQTHDKDILNLKNSTHSLTPLAFLNDTKYTTSVDTHFLDYEVMSPTEGVTLSTEVNNESRTLLFNGLENLYETKRSDNASSSSLFPNITVTTETISYRTTKDEISITTLDHLAKETSPKLESYSNPTLILNTTTFDESHVYVTIPGEKTTPGTTLDVINEIRPIILRDSEALMEGNTSKGLTNVSTESIHYNKMDVENHTSMDIHSIPTSTPVDVINEIRPIALSDSDILFHGNISKSSTNMSTESIPYNKMEVKNHSSMDIHSTPASTALDVINEIRPIILGDSDVLFQGNISQSLTDVSTESIPYNKMEVENHSSMDIHSTPASTTLDVINEIRPIILGDSDILFQGNISQSLTDVSTESIPYNKMEVENHTSMDIHSTPASTTLDVINEIRPIILGDSDILFQGNISQSLTDVSTESIPYNKMELKNHTSMDIHSTPASTTVDVINEIRPIILDDSNVLIEGNTSKSLTNLSTEFIPYNKMEVENHTSINIHSTPASTTVDVINEIRPIILGDSEALMEGITSKSLTKLSTGSIPYNKMEVENHTSVNIHSTPASTTVDVINEIRPIILGDSEALMEGITSKSLTKLSTEFIRYNKMEVENHTSVDIHSTPASTTVDVINEIRPIILGDSDILFHGNISKSSTNVSAEFIPYNKMAVENHTSMDIHSTPASTTVDVINEIRTITLSDSHALMEGNTSKSLTNVSTEFIPYNKMEVENHTSMDIYSIPASTTVDVNNEIRPIILGDSEALIQGNTSKKFTHVTKKSGPYNKIEVEKQISTKTPILSQSLVADADEPYSDSNILDFPVKLESQKGSMSSSSSFVTLASTNFFIYNTLSNESALYPPVSENEHTVLPVVNTKRPTTNQNGLKLKVVESSIIEKRDKNETKLIRDNLPFVNRDKMTTSLTENTLSIKSSVNVMNLKSTQDFKLATHKRETAVDELLSITTPVAVQQHVSKFNTDVLSVPKAFQVKGSRFPSPLSYSEKNNTSDNATFSTNLEKPIYLSDVNTSSDASDLNGSFDVISTYLNNDIVRSIGADKFIHNKNQNIIKNSTEIYDSFNVLDWSDTKTEIINTTMGQNFSETSPSMNSFNLYSDRFLDINIKDSNEIKSSAINLDITTEYRITFDNNENQNVTQYKKDAMVTIDSLTHINSNVSAVDNVLMATTKTSSFDNIYKVVNFTKPIKETKLVIKLPMSNNDKNFEGQNITESNVEEKKIQVETISYWKNNGTEKNILTSVTFNYQSASLNYFTNVNDSDQRVITEKNHVATVANDYDVTEKYHENEYNIARSANGQLLTQVEGVNVEYSNKTVNISLNSNTTIAIEEKHFLYYSLDSPTIESNNKMFDTNQTNKLGGLNNVIYDTIQNKSILADVIDRNEIVNQSRAVHTNNSVESYFKSLSKMQISLPTINGTYKLLSNNETTDKDALKASYYDNLKNNDNKLLHSSVSKTSLSNDMTDVLSTPINELSEKTFVETQTIRPSLPYAESTLNYLNTEKLSTESTRLFFEVTSTGTSKTENKVLNPQLIHRELTDSLVTTNVYNSASTQPTINKVTEIINENKTNIYSKSTVRIRQPNDYTGVIKIESEFVCVKRGKYSDRFDCNKFYLCIGLHKPLRGVCPPNTVFSEFLKQCTKNVAHCIRNNQFKCTTTGRFNNILSNNSYFICVKKNIGFIRFTLQCQKGYYLDKRNTKCTQESLSMSKSEENNSKNTSQVSVEKSKEGFDKKGYFECEREGKFNDPENCRRYYVCKKSKNSTFRRKVKECDSDEVFHKKKRKCVDEESYECKI
ncbi:unnamed protein product [Danaus chrysippus]|uniref:(African queen) hypothetical protein n=1 Tax=Danaus chrysippus TaxID=151541 RepID=A0A8J2W104_9NEOP|nr:unnamed protein product [Danaus chrysippus]